MGKKEKDIPDFYASRSYEDDDTCLMFFRANGEVAFLDRVLSILREHQPKNLEIGAVNPNVAHAGLEINGTNISGDFLWIDAHFIDNNDGVTLKIIYNTWPQDSYRLDSSSKEPVQKTQHKEITFSRDEEHNMTPFFVAGKIFEIINTSTTQRARPQLALVR